MQQRSIKQKIRSYCGPSLQVLGYSTGLMQLSSLLRKNKGTIILMYHSIADNSQIKWIDPDNHVSPEVFDQQMGFLSRYRNVISLNKLVDYLTYGITPPSGSIVITFDDGYLDNLTIAAPILDYYKLPATLFLPSGYIDRGETQWIDQVYSAFKFRTVEKLVWGLVPVHFDLEKAKQNKAGYQDICRDILSSSIIKRRKLLTDLFDQLQPENLPPRLTMTWNDVRTLLTKYPFFQIGGHTMDHIDLTNVNNKDAENELAACSYSIERQLGFRPQYFSFCYDRTSELLRKLTDDFGFDAACGGGGIDPVINLSTDRFRIPRIAAPATMGRFSLLTNSANTGFWRRLNP